MGQWAVSFVNQSVSGVALFSLVFRSFSVLVCGVVGWSCGGVVGDDVVDDDDFSHGPFSVDFPCCRWAGGC